MARKGREFEQAVHEFCRNLDENASIKFDHKVPDRDTGKLRQVDVWAQVLVLEHVPADVLISCKDHRRPLDVGAIEQFLGEKHSTRAHIGVLYSRSGFTSPALEKARENGVSCCKLFEDAPPETPSEIFVECFIAYPIYDLAVEPSVPEPPRELRWGDVPTMFVDRGPVGFATLVEALCFGLLDHVTRNDGNDQRAGPLDEVTSLDVRGTQRHPAFSVHAALTWRWFHGQLDLFRLRGSFNATSGSFSGQTSVGPIPMAYPPPTDTWTSCEPPTSAPNFLRLSVSALAWPTYGTIEAQLGPARVFGDGPWRFGPDAAYEIPSVLHGPGIEGPSLSISFQS